MNAIDHSMFKAPATVRTRYVNRRSEIPAEIRAHNLDALGRTIKVLEKAKAPPPSPGEVSLTQSRLESLRHLERLWEVCGTTFSAFDVVAADPHRVAHDEQTFSCGIYPTGPRGYGSGAGSPAEMCAALGG